MTLIKAGLIAAAIGLAAGGATAQTVAETIALPEGMVFPEGIVEDGNGSLILSVFGSGAILRIDQAGVAEIYKSAGEDGLAAPVGLAIDASRDRLWVSSINPETFMSKLHVFTLSSGELQGSIDAPAAMGPHFFNEIVLAADGRAYISDTLQPRIWTVGPDSVLSLEEFAVDPLLANPDPERALGMNGLAISPDGNYLIASIMDRMSQGGGRLVRVDVVDRTVQDVALAGDLAEFGGSDGMFFLPDGRLLMVNVTPPSALATASFSSDFSEANVASLAAADQVVDRPSSIALRDGKLWIVNSQLDHVLDDGNGAMGTPPDLPFEIVGVDVADIFSE